jgi:hypothetical protein
MAVSQAAIQSELRTAAVIFLIAFARIGISVFIWRSPGFSQLRAKYLAIVYYFALAVGTESLPATTFSYSASMARWIMFRVSALAG